MLRGVVFDLDGVLVDSHPVHIRAWRKFLEAMGRAVSEEQLQFVLDGRKRDDILGRFLGELNKEELFEYGHRKEQIWGEEALDLRVIDGLPSFLEDLEDAQQALAVASSGGRSRVDFVLQQLDLKKHFRVVVTGDEVEQGKPDPAVFLKAAQGLRMHPSELMVFEDAVSGVRAAKAAGMTCLGIAHPDRASILLAAGAKHVVPDFRSLSYSRLQHIFANEPSVDD